MKLDDIIITFEQAKKLKELGIEQGTTAIVWIKTNNENVYLSTRSLAEFEFPNSEFSDAFTLEELANCSIGTDLNIEDDVESVEDLNVTNICNIIIVMLEEADNSEQAKQFLNNINENLKQYKE